MYLLDTDTLIWLIRGNSKVIHFLENLSTNQRTFVSTVTIAEVYKNIFPSEIIKSDECIYHNGIVPLDDYMAKQAGLYWRDYNKKLAGLSITDCMIAATAKMENLILLTSNTRHFPMHDIKVQNPLK